MDLWIRSQDKKSLIKVSNVKYTYKESNLYTDVRWKHYIGTYYDNLEILGEYKSKERALEVLDEIDEFIDLFQRNGFGNVLSDDGVHPKHTIYEMPEE